MKKNPTPQAKQPAVKRLIFISHSKEDKEIANAFTKNILIGLFQLTDQNWFCSSLKNSQLSEGNIVKQNKKCCNTNTQLVLV